MYVFASTPAARMARASRSVDEEPGAVFALFELAVAGEIDGLCEVIYIEAGVSIDPKPGAVVSNQ